MQPQQPQQQQKGDAYEKPGPQIVHISGTSCVEQVSLPLLQRYYTNVNMYGAEVAYYGVNYIEFPLFDSLTKIIGDVLRMDVQFTMHYFSDHELIPRYFNGEELEPLVDNVNFVLDIDTTGIRSLFELASRVTQKLALIAQAMHEWPSVVDPLSSWRERPEWKTLFFFLSEYQYEFDVGKFAFVFKKPLQFTTTGYYPVQIVTTLRGSQTGEAQSLCAAMFGGKKITSTDYTWSSPHDTGRSIMFYSWLKQLGKIPPKLQYLTPATSSAVTAAMFRGSQVVHAHSVNPPTMFSDAYVYIRGAPEASIWNPDGSSSDLIMVVPRNKVPGQIVDVQSFMGTEGHSIKTSLASLRMMNLRFTNAAGDLLKIDEPYSLDLIITFKE